MNHASLPALSRTMLIFAAVKQIAIPRDAEGAETAAQGDDFLRRIASALSRYRMMVETSAGEDGRRVTATFHRTGEPDDFFMDIRAAVLRELAADSHAVCRDPNEAVAQADFDRARAVFTADADGITLTLEYDRFGRAAHHTVKFDFDDAPTAIGLLAESIASSLMDGNPAL